MSIPLADVIDLTITIADRAVSQQGFGTIMVVGPSQHIAPLRVKTYSSSSWSAAMTADGYTTDDEEYRAVQAIMSQSPRVSTVKVGRRASANTPQQAFTLTPLNVEEGSEYTILINGTEFKSIAGAGETDEDVVDDLVAAVNGGTFDITATDEMGSLSLDEDSAGLGYDIWFEGDFTVVNDTTDANVATELNAIASVDSDWYGLIQTGQSDAEIEATAAWAESNKKRYNPTTNTSAVPTSATDDVGSNLQDATYNYTKLWYNTHPGQYHGAAAMSKEFSQLPGTYTITFQGVSGVTRTDLGASALGQLRSKNVGVVEPFGGLTIMFDGKASSGRYVDATRFVDWLHARIQESIANLLVNARGKIPFTNSGIGLVKNAINGPILIAVNRGALIGEGDQAPLIEAPLAANVSQGNKANRNLPDVNFYCVYTGAIESVAINGFLSL